MLNIFNLSGISLGNISNIIEIRKSDGWEIVTVGFDIYAFRLTTVSE